MPNWLFLLLVIPTVTAFVGWVTNWAAVKMIFWPESWIGVGPVGWQGVAYRHNRKFAQGTADLAGDTLLTADDIAERVRPEELEELYEEAFAQRARPILRDCAEIVLPGLWDRMPRLAQDAVIARVRSEGLRSLKEGYQEFQGRSREFIDLRGLVVETLTRDGGRNMAAITQKMGARELRFIEIYGGVFGFLIGVVEVGLWSVFQIWWLLPIVGGIVGIVTNWLAIQMIFRPLEPTRYLGLVTYQGLFPRRQKQIAKDYAQVTATQIVTARNLIGHLVQGEGGQRLAEMASRMLEEGLESQVRSLGGPVPGMVLGERLEEVKKAIVAHVLVAIPDLRPDFEAYLDERLNVAELIEERMATLTPEQFEGILRGVFQEDEVTLILLGGFLGALIGLGQAGLILLL